MAQGWTTSGEPSGRLQTARTSCSNWLVTQARSLHQAKYGDGGADLRPDGWRP
jgi:hypothetical protein